MNIEGYWYSKHSPEYPKPVPNVLSGDEAQAIYALIKKKEKTAKVTRFRGPSESRIERGFYVGSMEYELKGWKWPEGFAEHYVLKHKVRPSDNFLKFIGYKCV